MKNKNTVLIIDGHNLAYRSFHQPARKHLRCSDGRRSGVFYGFMTDMHRLILQFKPIAVIVAFDTITGAKINKEYVGYKDNRKPPKKYLLNQIKDIRKALKYLSVKVIWKDGWEADDIIYGVNLAYRNYPQSRSVIVTADHDLLQCIDKWTAVYDDRFKKFWNEEIFLSHYKFEAWRLPLYKALVGDKSDGVKGTPGIGPKNALRLLKKCEWEPKILKKLTSKQQEEFRFSLKAVRLRTDVKLQDFIHRKLEEQRVFKKKKCLKLMEKYQCRSIINKFPKWAKTFRTRFRL